MLLQNFFDNLILIYFDNLILIYFEKMEINADEQELLGTFMVNALANHVIAMRLKDSFIGRCIIDPDATTRYMIERTPQFAPFMRALFQVMSTFLPTQVSDSQHGLGIISDFDVFHNFGTDSARQVYFSANPLMFNRLGPTKIDTLKSNALKLRRFLINQRKSLIMHWDLPDGDWTEKKKSAEKKRTVPTPQSVSESAELLLEDVSQKQAKRMYQAFRAGMYLKLFMAIL
jgi:hypothetical protein